LIDCPKHQNQIQACCFFFFLNAFNLFGRKTCFFPAHSPPATASFVHETKMIILDSFELLLSCSGFNAPWQCMVPKEISSTCASLSAQRQRQRIFHFLLTQIRPLAFQLLPLIAFCSTSPTRALTLGFAFRYWKRAEDQFPRDLCAAGCQAGFRKKVGKTSG
jgi:hypothetical protein